MLLIDIPEMEYVVFEHGPFNYEEEKETVYNKITDAIHSFDFLKTEYKLDYSAGRIEYGFFDPKKYKACYKKM